MRFNAAAQLALARNIEIVDETRLYLSVGGFGPDPSVVTALLGLTPTFAGAASEPPPVRPSMRPRLGRWELASPLPRSEPVAAHIAALLLALETRASEVRELLARFDALLQCVIYVRNGCNPGFDLPNDLVTRIGSLGLSPCEPANIAVASHMASPAAKPLRSSTHGVR